MNSNAQTETQKYRLSWKGALHLSTPLLYIEDEHALIFVIPILLLLYIPKLLFSYLRVSPQGLELRYASLYRVKTSWQNIEHFGKSKAYGEFTRDALFLKKAVAVAPENRVARWLGDKIIREIVIGDFRGWPDGELAQALQQHIPHIFVDETNKPT